jgi:hypothetical protein
MREWIMGKFTIQFGPKASETLRALAEEQGVPQTEIVRRAIGVYAVLVKEAKKGNRVVFENANGEKREVIAAI